MLLFYSNPLPFVIFCVRKVIDNKNIFSFFFHTKVCENKDWAGNGYCDDQTNILVCNYDGGDCCGPNVNKQYCTECQCKNGGETTANPGPTDDEGSYLFHKQNY